MSERIGIAQPEDNNPHNCWALVFGLGGGQCVHEARPEHLTCHEHADLERAALALCAATGGVVYGAKGHGTTTGVILGPDAVVVQLFPRPGQADKKEG